MERERDYKTPQPPPGGNNKSANIVGIAIVFLGIILLLRNLDIGFPFPRNIFGWEMILIIIGIVIGVNSKFEKNSAIFLIAFGGLFFLKRFLDVPFWGTIFPIFAIVIGIYFIARNRNQSPPPVPPQNPPGTHTDEFDWDKRVDIADADASQSDEQQEAHTHTHQGENYIKVESIFGSAKKLIFSKDFRGGTLTNLFGSTEINLLQADLKQPVALDVFQIAGSTKIIVPPHWIVATTASSILSEHDDRRVIIPKIQDQSKYLYITGTSILGSITIKNS